MISRFVAKENLQSPVNPIEERRRLLQQLVSAPTPDSNPQANTLMVLQDLYKISDESSRSVSQDGPADNTTLHHLVCEFSASRVQNGIDWFEEQITENEAEKRTLEENYEAACKDAESLRQARLLIETEQDRSHEQFIPFLQEVGQQNEDVIESTIRMNKSMAEIGRS